MKRSTALALAGAALAGAATPARAQTVPTLRIGITSVESYAQGAYAQAMGFFAQAGLDADVQYLTNGSVVTAAVVGGSLDFGTTNCVSMANAYVHGFPLYCVAPSSLYTSASPTTVLVTLKDSPIRTAKDLNGKVLGITTLHDLMQASVMKWIDDNGGDSRTISYPEIHNADLMGALTAKRVDASILLEPQLTDNKDVVRILAKPYDAVASLLMISGWITTKSFYDANRATVAKFAAVMRQTADWANKNPNQAAEILARLSKIPLETVLKMNHNVWGTTLDPALIQPTIDASVKYGFLPHPFTASEMFPPRA